MHQVSSRLNYLGVQGVARKYWSPYKSPGLWAGSILFQNSIIIYKFVYLRLNGIRVIKSLHLTRFIFSKKVAWNHSLWIIIKWRYNRDSLFVSLFSIPLLFHIWKSFIYLLALRDQVEMIRFGVTPKMRLYHICNRCIWYILIMMLIEISQVRFQ